ncbi:MAG: hypothetical protein KJO27_01240 [Gammaproteobacteria bacterium]|nr:hypothetical protein [Gammaproteobacteria bacterium]NNL44025.1 hypothetical protein [Woeseiaceae bacterium]
MNLFVRNRQFLLVAALATLAVRALTPDGYMPGSAHSGLLYELCPEGMPAEIMQALAGDSHHHHHGGGDDVASPGSSEQCPIGHMLASVIATDSNTTSDVLPDTPLFNEDAVALIFGAQATGYRSRAPPA